MTIRCIILLLCIASSLRSSDRKGQEQRGERPHRHHGRHVIEGRLERTGRLPEVARQDGAEQVGARLEEPDHAVRGADLLHAEVLGQQEGDHEEHGPGADKVDGDSSTEGEAVAADGHGVDGSGRGERDGAEDEVGVDEARVEEEAEADPPDEVADGGGEQDRHGGLLDVNLVGVCGDEEEEVRRPESNSGSLFFQQDLN